MTYDFFVRWMGDRLLIKELAAARMLGHPDPMASAIDVREDMQAFALAPERPAVLTRFRPMRAPA